MNNPEISGEEAIPQHTKRFGRELAMQYLFECDARAEMPGAASFEEFFDSVTCEHENRENRLFRRARDYAVLLYQTEALCGEAIDRIISAHCTNWKLNRLSPVERNVLRTAAAETAAVPDLSLAVIIDEATRIARDFAGQAAGVFVNGVLNSMKPDLEKLRRGSAREKESTTC